MSLAEMIDAVNGVVWALPLVGLCLAAGLYFTIRTGGLQVSGLPDMIATMGKGEKSADGTSSFQSLMMSLANRVGMGNIGGVATAITFGGPGAVFWMWVMAFLGAATSFIECTLGQIYKEKEAYRHKAPTLSLVYAVTFSVVTVFAMAFFLPGVQANGMSSAISLAWGVPTWATAIGVVILLAFIGLRQDLRRRLRRGRGRRLDHRHGHQVGRPARHLLQRGRSGHRTAPRCRRRGLAPGQAGLRPGLLGLHRHPVRVHGHGVHHHLHRHVQRLPQRDLPRADALRRLGEHERRARTGLRPARIRRLRARARLLLRRGDAGLLHLHHDGRLLLHGRGEPVLPLPQDPQPPRPSRAHPGPAGTDPRLRRLRGGQHGRVRLGSGRHRRRHDGVVEHRGHPRAAGAGAQGLPGAEEAGGRPAVRPATSRHRGRAVLGAAGPTAWSAPGRASAASARRRWSTEPDVAAGCCARRRTSWPGSGAWQPPSTAAEHSRRYPQAAKGVAPALVILGRFGA